MAKLIISERENNLENILYIKESVNELISHTKSQLRIYKTGDRICLSVICSEYYKDIIQAEIIDKISEIIVIKYKYEFFKERTKVAGLNEEERELLYTGLISADLEEDKKYTFYKIGNAVNVSIDGTYNFLLKALKRKWQDIISYIPICFISHQLNDFICYLLEHKSKRVYIDDGIVYDNHYRKLKRSKLLGDEKMRITKEVLLSNCGEVELNGNIPKEDEKYLKEFYRDKIFFRDNIR